MEPEPAASHVRAAKAEVETETRLTKTEVRALREFQTRLADLEIEQPRTDGGAPTPALLQQRQQSPSVGCEQVWRAYRDTVLAMPHYADEYGESPREHMAAEFRPELVQSLVDAPRLTPQLRQALDHASSQAQKRRIAFLTKLDTESDALETARTELADVTTPVKNWSEESLESATFEELRSLYESLQDARERCGEVAETRQQSLQSDEWAAPKCSYDSSLHSYLYADLDVTYPILADVAERLLVLRRASRQVERAIATVE